MSTNRRLNIKSKVRDYSVSSTGRFGDIAATDYAKRPYFIVDRNVARLYAKELGGLLRQSPNMIIEAREENKTLEYVNIVARRLIEGNVKRDWCLVAVGGGIIQDITAFTASILFRGIDWIFYPTTLLAQSDSCIGSKTSINLDEYKNQVGNFYPPAHVYLNVRFLETLAKKDIKSGMGEIIKVHLLDGPGSLEYIRKNYDKAMLRPEEMERLVFRSLAIKKRVIEIDEFDRGYRNIMNYGHTFGHALESLTDYALPHGQAVTIGMDLSNYLSYKLGYISVGLYMKMRDIIVKNWPAYDFKRFNEKIFYKHLSKDKKNIGQATVMILTRGPGRMFKKAAAMDDRMKGLISSYFEMNIYKAG